MPPSFPSTKEKLDDIRRARAFSQLFSKDPRAVINREVDFDLSLPFDPAATKRKRISDTFVLLRFFFFLQIDVVIFINICVVFFSCRNRLLYVHDFAIMKSRGNGNIAESI